MDWKSRQRDLQGLRLGRHLNLSSQAKADTNPIHPTRTRSAQIPRIAPFMRRTNSTRSISDAASEIPSTKASIAAARGGFAGATKPACDQNPCAPASMLDAMESEVNTAITGETGILCGVSSTTWRQPQPRSYGLQSTHRCTRELRHSGAAHFGKGNILKRGGLPWTAAALYVPHMCAEGSTACASAPRLKAGGGRRTIRSAGGTNTGAFRSLLDQTPDVQGIGGSIELAGPQRIMCRTTPRAQLWAERNEMDASNIDGCGGRSAPRRSVALPDRMTAHGKLMSRVVVRARTCGDNLR